MRTERLPSRRSRRTSSVGRVHPEDGIGVVREIEKLWDEISRLTTHAGVNTESIITVITDDSDNIDGGFASSVYLDDQHIDGGEG